MIITIIGRWSCPKTRAALKLAERIVTKKNVDPSLDDGPRIQYMQDLYDYRTVPLVFLDATFIGGHDELEAWWASRSRR